MACKRNKAMGWSHITSVMLYTDDSPSCSYPALGRIKPELNGLHGKTLTLDATISFRIIFHAAGRLHSMVLLGSSSDVIVGARE